MQYRTYQKNTRRQGSQIRCVNVRTEFSNVVKMKLLFGFKMFICYEVRGFETQLDHEEFKFYNFCHA